MPDRKGHYFGGLLLPHEAGPHHTLILGKIGAGKTLTLRMMMGTVFSQFAFTPDLRAVILDVKQDMLSLLSGMGVPDERVVILNPFDRRTSAWDIAADITSPEAALQLATIFIPVEESSTNRYFSDAARDILRGVIEVFNERAPGRWHLGDLLYAMRSQDRMRHVLSQTPDGKELIALHLEIGNASRSVVATARAFLAPFDVIGATWGRAWQAGRKLSLHQFLKQSQILVMGNNQAAVTAIQSINRLLFQRLTELLLDQSESDARRCWCFLDEVQKLGKLDGLVDLMVAGRSKAVCVVLGLQAIEGLKAVYGDELAEVILSMCGSIGVVKVSGVITPRWCSDYFGEQEIRESTRSVAEATTMGASPSQTITETTTEVIKERRYYLPSEFQMIPLPEKGKPLYGFFRSDFLDSKPYYAQIPPSEVSKYLHPHNPNRADFEPWPDESYKKLPIWEAEDYARLGLPPLWSQLGFEPDDPKGPEDFKDPNQD